MNDQIQAAWELYKLRKADAENKMHDAVKLRAMAEKEFRHRIALVCDGTTTSVTLDGLSCNITTVQTVILT